MVCRHTEHENLLPLATCSWKKLTLMTIRLYTVENGEHAHINSQFWKHFSCCQDDVYFTELIRCGLHLLSPRRFQDKLRFNSYFRSLQVTTAFTVFFCLKLKSTLEKNRLTFPHGFFYIPRGYLCASIIALVINDSKMISWWIFLSYGSLSHYRRYHF